MPVLRGGSIKEPWQASLDMLEKRELDSMMKVLWSRCERATRLRARRVRLLSADLGICWFRWMAIRLDLSMQYWQSGASRAASL
jgi:hypothetical protein